MTPKEKAVELFNKMKGFRVKHTHSKKCAVIAVDEILKALPEDHQSDIWSYWEQVKTELENL